MMASPLFIKVRLTSGGVKENQKFVYVDAIQIVAIEEIEMADSIRQGGPEYPAVRLHLLGGATLFCWDEDRTGVEELSKLKTQFYQNAINPRIVTPGQMAAMR